MDTSPPPVDVDKLLALAWDRMHSPQFYRLHKREVIPCYDVAEWAEAFDVAARRVGLWSRHGVEVSTVFLGLDHQFGHGPPLLFESMVFGGPMDGECARCSTYAQAEIMHKLTVLEVIRALTWRARLDMARTNARRWFVRALATVRALFVWPSKRSKP